jgi:hypothetical protein
MSPLKLLSILHKIEAILKPGTLFHSLAKETTYCIFILDYIILFKKKKLKTENSSHKKNKKIFFFK